MKKKICAMLSVGVLALVFGITSVALASPIELVKNGEFEVPGITEDWTAVPNASILGWSSTSEFIEIWKQGFLGSPSLGSDNVPTGQHHEVAYDADTNVTTQGFGALGSNGFVDLSFDAWKRGDTTGIIYSLSSGRGYLIDPTTYSFTTSSAWVPISVTGIPVLAGDILTLSFQSYGGGGSGAHIDQVSLGYSAVPEPATMLLLGLGLIGLAGVRRKFKK